MNTGYTELQNNSLGEQTISPESNDHLDFISILPERFNSTSEIKDTQIKSLESERLMDPKVDTIEKADSV